ncbi:MAG TPA: PAS domain S-box protein [Gallionellaceae bacterium]|nr:PAS domain S-box protein [Gallionellaceae bacterium]
MKNAKLSALLNTPLGVVVILGAVVLAVESLIMILRGSIMAQFMISHAFWDIADPILLTIIVAPLLYFLVFRKMQESEERYRQINNAALNAIVIVNEQGRITGWNRAAEKMFQYSSEEAVGRLMHQLIVPPRFLDDAEHGFARFQETGSGPVIGKVTEISALRKDGSEFSIELSISAVRLKGHWHAIGIIHDITERKQAEAQIHLFRELLDHSNDGICIAEPATSRFLDVNETACSDLRYTRDELLHRGVLDIQTAFLDIIDWHAHVQELRAQGRLLLEFDALRKDGSLFPAEASLQYATIMNQDYIIAVVRDITERRQAEAVLRESEQRFQHLFENMSSGVAVYQPDATCETFTFKSVNHALERIERVKREEVLGRSVEEAFPGVRALGLLEVFQRVCRSGEPEHFPPAFYQDERVTGWRENYVYRLDSGEIVAVYDDVTERKRTEEELLLRAQLLDSTVDSILVHDFDGNFVYLNEAAWKTRGYTRDELMAMNLHALDVPEYEKLIDARIKELMEKGQGTYESAHRRKDGSVIPIEINAHIIESGGRKLVLSTVRDTTERKQAEKESLAASIRTRDALEDAIGAIAATLEQRDPYTAGHQRRVGQLAAAIGEEMGLDREAIEGIRFGGMIHDLGKVSVPAEILGKPGRLTDIEFGLIQVHAEAGYQIVKDIAFPWPVADMVRQHHERLDGSGYPQGLAGEQIILEARILAVADVVEAMSANRPYRPGFGMDAALDEITRGRGSQLDVMAVDACLRVIREKGFVFAK